MYSGTSPAKLVEETASLSEKVFYICIALLLSPLFIIHCLAQVLMLKPLFVIETFYYGNKKVDLKKFNNNFAGSRLARVFSLLHGEIDLVGAKIHLSPDTINYAELTSPAWSRPGIWSILDVWSQTGFKVWNLQKLYEKSLHTHSFSDTVMVLLRVLACSVYQSADLLAPQTISVLGVRFENLSMTEAVRKMVTLMQSADKVSDNASKSGCKVVSFVNANNLNIGFTNGQYKACLDHADLVLPDGSGVRMAAKIKHLCLKDNLNGTDLFPIFMSELNRLGASIYFLGGDIETNQKVQEKARVQFSNTLIVGGTPGYFSSEENDQVLEEINHHGADVLFVAMGSPRQELWVEQNREQLNCRLVVNVGGLFDFYSERIQRAPVWIRELGMEWVWRMICEPSRLWKRYVVGNPLFIFRVITHKSI
jgi:exopolysaccharide biosynthesis WecB/TagA/CpsF family protein